MIKKPLLILSSLCCLAPQILQASHLIQTEQIHRVNHDALLPVFTNVSYAFVDCKTGSFLTANESHAVVRSPNCVHSWTIIKDKYVPDGLGGVAYKIVAKDGRLLFDGSKEAEDVVHPGVQEATENNLRHGWSSWAFADRQDGIVVASNRLSRRWIYCVPEDPCVRISRWYGNQNDGHDYTPGSLQKWKLIPQGHKFQGTMLAFYFHQNVGDLINGTPTLAASSTVRNNSKTVTNKETIEHEFEVEEKVSMTFEGFTSSMFEQFSTFDTTVSEHVQTRDHVRSSSQYDTLSETEKWRMDERFTDEKLHVECEASVGGLCWSASAKAGYSQQNVSSAATEESKKMSSFSRLISSNETETAIQKGATDHLGGASGQRIVREERRSDMVSKSVKTKYKVTSCMVVPPETGVKKDWIVVKAENIAVPFTSYLRVQALKEDGSQFYDANMVKFFMVHAGFTNCVGEYDDRSMVYKICGNLRASLGLNTYTTIEDLSVVSAQ